MFDKEKGRLKTQAQIVSYFRGMNVIADYGNNRRYRITDVDFEKTPSTKFPGGKYKSYADYLL
jgi:hypothetical protein